MFTLKSLLKPFRLPKKTYTVCYRIGTDWRKANPHPTLELAEKQAYALRMAEVDSYIIESTEE